MSLGHYFKKCPACWSPQIREVSRVEAGRFEPEDYAIYQCNECNYMFDYITDPNDALAMGEPEPCDTDSPEKESRPSSEGR